jgi:hypothetical protein
VYEEHDQINEFIWSVINFVEEYTDFKNYDKLSPESKEKYVNKLTLLICFETSPRKNYDIGMESIRHIVRDILTNSHKRVSNDE